MDQKNAGYLTIGEISGLTGINPKSIRYYERIGAFSPAVVDAKTGYRYYTPSQLNHLAAIQNCIQMGIPLRDFTRYYTDGTIYTDRFLQDAFALSHEKIRQLNRNLEQLERLSTYVQQADRLIAEQKTLEFPYPEITFLIREIKSDLDSYSLYRCYADLTAEAHRQSLLAEPLHGTIALFRQGTLHRLYAGVAVSGQVRDGEWIALPEAVYAARFTPESRITQAQELFPSETAADRELLVFESEVVASQYNANSPGYILRCIRR